MKISLVGAGNIGGTLAHLAITKKLAQEVVILDINKGVASGKALDIAQSMPVAGASVKVIGTDDFSYLSNSSVVIVTAGIARKPGMSRDDLLNTNARIIKDVGQKIAKFASEAFVIVVTNPLDAMAWAMHKATGFETHKVVGMAGILDTSRMNLFLAQELDVCPTDVSSLVLGSHGDSMVPLIRYSTVSGIPLEQFIKNGAISRDKVDFIVERTKSGGIEIVNLLKSGSAYYAPAASAMQMAESYIKDQKKILPCSVCLKNHYGVQDQTFCGAPVLINKEGAKKIIDLDLTKQESDMFNNSVALARQLISKVSL